MEENIKNNEPIMEYNKTHKVKSAIIQARMGSTRLSGKVLMDINGRPMLEHVIRRVKESKLIDNIIIATTEKAEDKPIWELASDLGVWIFPGNEYDVLDRYYMAATWYKVDTIVRITSDCPLIDPKVVGEVIEYYLANKHDYVANIGIYPDGLDTEIFSYSILKKVWSETDTPYDREHVTSYIRDHPELFKIGRLQYTRNLAHLKWSVDTAKDLEFVRYIYGKLGDKFDMEDVLNEIRKIS